MIDAGRFSSGRLLFNNNPVDNLTDAVDRKNLGPVFLQCDNEDVPEVSRSPAHGRRGASRTRHPRQKNDSGDADVLPRQVGKQRPRGQFVSSPSRDGNRGKGWCGSV